MMNYMIRFRVVYKLSDASEGVTCGHMDHSDTYMVVRQGLYCTL